MPVPNHLKLDEIIQDEDDINCIILALSTYVDSGKVKDDNYNEEKLWDMRQKLKLEANRVFNSNWCVFGTDQED